MGKRKYTYKGKGYTMKELSKHPDCKVNYKTLKTRLHRGWEIKKAMLEDKRDTVEYKYGNKKYSVIELSKHPDCKISYSSLKTRLHRGWEIKEAVVTPVKNKKE